MESKGNDEKFVGPGNMRDGERKLVGPGIDVNDQITLNFSFIFIPFLNFLSNQTGTNYSDEQHISISLREDGVGGTLTEIKSVGRNKFYHIVAISNK